MLVVRVLASSSEANATLVSDGEVNLLVDCGLGPLLLREALEAVSMQPGDLHAVLVTHHHKDHANSATIRRLAEVDVPVFCSKGTRAGILARPEFRDDQRITKCVRALPRTPLALGSAQVVARPLLHDADQDCHGFRITIGPQRRRSVVAVVTDFGLPFHPDDDVALRADPAAGLSGSNARALLQDADVMLVASNHDVDILRENRRVPASVKRDHIIPFHPSNRQAAALLSEALSVSRNPPRAVALLHLSEEMNTSALALAAARTAVRKHGKPAPSVVVSTPRQAVDVVWE